MAKIFINGRLGRDAVVKEPANGGNKYVVFTVADSRKIKGEEKTTWYEVRSFNNVNLAPYLKKGSAVIVVGSLEASTNVGKDGKTYINLNVLADSIEFDGNSSPSVKTSSTETTVASTPTSAKDSSAPSDAEINMGNTAKSPAPVVVEADNAANVADSKEEDGLPF